MKTSCICHPENTRFIQLHQWQKDFCQGNHCAAFLLSFFSSWHDWKILNDYYYRRYNNIAEAHGDGRPHNENAYLFFTMEEFSEALMGLFGKKSISEAINLLAELGVISVHKNPTPCYCFDKTKYFRFYPKVCNEWLDLNKDAEENTQVVDNFDHAEMDDRTRKNALPSSENGRPASKNARYIKNYNTNHITNQNNSHSLNTCEDDFLLEEKILPECKTNPHEQHETREIVDALIAKGMRSKQFYPDAVAAIARLKQSGATRELFLQAFDKAKRTTQAGHFGINYLAKIVEDLLAKQNNPQRNKPPPKNQQKNVSIVYENDYEKGLDWMGDLV